MTQPQANPKTIATSCSSENSLVVVEPIYDQMIAALANAGGFLLNEEQGQIVISSLAEWEMTTTLLAGVDQVLDATSLPKQLLTTLSF